MKCGKRQGREKYRGPQELRGRALSVRGRVVYHGGGLLVVRLVSQDKRELAT